MIPMLLMQKFLHCLQNIETHILTILILTSSMKHPRVHESVVIGPNVYIGPECKIGKNSVIHANSSLVMNVEIGKNTIIHFNSILGSDGFGYAPHKDGYIKIEQLGN